MTQVHKNYGIKYSTKRKNHKNIINLLVAVIAVTGKTSIKKAQKTVYIGNNISLRQSTTNINYQYETFESQKL